MPVDAWMPELQVWVKWCSPVLLGGRGKGDAADGLDHAGFVLVGFDPLDAELGREGHQLPACEVEQVDDLDAILVQVACWKHAVHGRQGSD